MSRSFSNTSKSTMRPAKIWLERLEERATPTVNVSPIIAVGSGPGMDATVKVLDSSGNLLSTFKPYSTFGGGVYTAVGDINGDSVADVITGAGQGGGPHVKVFNGVDIAAGSSNPGVLRDFFAYQPDFFGGVSVAAGDVNGDGLIDVVTGAGPTASPHVVAYSNGIQNQQLMNFFPYPLGFRGGVNVACGDFGGDGVTDEIVTGAGPGGGPLVALYNFLDDPTPTLAFQRLAQFYAFDSSQTGGVEVAAGFTTNNRDASNFLYADVIAGTGAGPTAEVRTYRLLDALEDPLGNPNWQYNLAGTVNPFTTFTGGVRVGVVRNGLLDDFTVGAGPSGGPVLNIYNQTSIVDLQTYTPTQRFQAFEFDPAFLGGIYVS